MEFKIDLKSSNHQLKIIILLTIFYQWYLVKHETAISISLDEKNHKLINVQMTAIFSYCFNNIKKDIYWFCLNCDNAMICLECFPIDRRDNFASGNV